MRTIRSAEVLLTSPGRNYVTLKVTTDDGIVGWGDATVNGRELAVASYLRDHIAPLLVGLDADRIEDTWQYLYRGVYWRRGPITMAAIGAVDLALWDIKGKALNQPVARLIVNLIALVQTLYLDGNFRGHLQIPYACSGTRQSQAML